MQQYFSEKSSMFVCYIKFYLGWLDVSAPQTQFLKEQCKENAKVYIW